MALAAPLPARPLPEPVPRPKPEHFRFNIASAGGCSTSLVSGFALDGFIGKNGVTYPVYRDGRAHKYHFDWSLPLPQDFLDAVSKRFDVATAGSYTKPDTLLASTVAASTNAFKTGALGYVGSYAVIEYILENTGWIRGACGMGQHDYPVQAWTRPSGGIQLSHKE